MGSLVWWDDHTGVNLTMPTCREGREVKRMAKLVQQGLTSGLLKGVQGSAGACSQLVPSRGQATQTKTKFGPMADADRIFTNIYGRHAERPVVQDQGDCGEREQVDHR